MADTRVAGVGRVDFVRSLRVGTLAFCLIFAFRLCAYFDPLSASTPSDSPVHPRACVSETSSAGWGVEGPAAGPPWLPVA